MTIMTMTIGDKVRASYPYAGVPACDGKIIKKLVLGPQRTQFLVSFEVRPRVYKKFYLTERELTLCPLPEAEEPTAALPEAAASTVALPEAAIPTVDKTSRFVTDRTGDQVTGDV